jgi:hypothetical protein
MNPKSAMILSILIFLEPTLKMFAVPTPTIKNSSNKGFATPTSENSSAIGFATPTVKNSSVTSNPFTHEVHMRIENQWLRVQLREKTGKLTKDQAVTLRADLKSIRAKELAFYKQNKKHQLTANQENNLHEMLNKNSKTLGEVPITTNQ